MDREDSDSKIFKKVGLLLSGPLVVFISFWVIFFALKLLETLLHSWALVSKDENSVTYDSTYAILWQVVRFLNGRIMGPIIALALVLLLGVSIFLRFEGNKLRIYFAMSFIISYVLYILMNMWLIMG